MSDTQSIHISTKGYSVIIHQSIYLFIYLFIYFVYRKSNIGLIPTNHYERFKINILSSKTRSRGAWKSTGPVCWTTPAQGLHTTWYQGMMLSFEKHLQLFTGWCGHQYQWLWQVKIMKLYVILFNYFLWMWRKIMIDMRVTPPTSEANDIMIDLHVTPTTPPL